MARIDDLFAGWDDDEVDEEYVAAQRAKRDRRALEPPPQRVQTEPPINSGTRQGGVLTVQTAEPRVLGGKGAKVKCGGRALVKDADQEPILDADGARQYRPCRNYALPGMAVCRVHGGASPQARQKAIERLLAAVESVADALARKATDERMDDNTRYKFIAGLLDRVGIRAGMDVGIEDPRWQQILAGMFGSQDGPIRTIDAEVVDIVELNASVGERFTPDHESDANLTPEQRASADAQRYVNNVVEERLAKGKGKRR